MVDNLLEKDIELEAGPSSLFVDDEQTAIAGIESAESAEGKKPKPKTVVKGPVKDLQNLLFKDAAISQYTKQGKAQVTAATVIEKDSEFGAKTSAAIVNLLDNYEKGNLHGEALRIMSRENVRDDLIIIATIATGIASGKEAVQELSDIVNGNPADRKKFFHNLQTLPEYESARTAIGKATQSFLDDYQEIATNNPTKNLQSWIFTDKYVTEDVLNNKTVAVTGTFGPTTAAALYQLVQEPGKLDAHISDIYADPKVKEAFWKLAQVGQPALDANANPEQKSEYEAAVIQNKVDFATASKTKDANYFKALREKDPEGLDNAVNDLFQQIRSKEVGKFVSSPEFAAELKQYIHDNNLKLDELVKTGFKDVRFKNADGYEYNVEKYYASSPEAKRNIENAAGINQVTQTATVQAERTANVNDLKNDYSALVGELAKQYATSEEKIEINGKETKIIDYLKQTAAKPMDLKSYATNLAAAFEAKNPNGTEADFKTFVGTVQSNLNADTDPLLKVAAVAGLSNSKVAPLASKYLEAENNMLDMIEELPDTDVKSYLKAGAKQIDDAKKNGKSIWDSMKEQGGIIAVLAEFLQNIFDKNPGAAGNAVTDPSKATTAQKQEQAANNLSANGLISPEVIISDDELEVRSKVRQFAKAEKAFADNIAGTITVIRPSNMDALVDAIPANNNLSGNQVDRTLEYYRNHPAELKSAVLEGLVASRQGKKTLDEYVSSTKGDLDVDATKGDTKITLQVRGRDGEPTGKTLTLSLSGIIDNASAHNDVDADKYRKEPRLDVSLEKQFKEVSKNLDKESFEYLQTLNASTVERVATQPFFEEGLKNLNAKIAGTLKLELTEDLLTKIPGVDPAIAADIKAKYEKHPELISKNVTAAMEHLVQNITYKQFEELRYNNYEGVNLALADTKGNKVVVPLRAVYENATVADREAIDSKFKMLADKVEFDEFKAGAKDFRKETHDLKMNVKNEALSNDSRGLGLATAIGSGGGLVAAGIPAVAAIGVGALPIVAAGAAAGLIVKGAIDIIRGKTDYSKGKDVYASEEQAADNLEHLINELTVKKVSDAFINQAPVTVTSEALKNDPEIQDLVGKFAKSGCSFKNVNTSRMAEYIAGTEGVTLENLNSDERKIAKDYKEAFEQILEAGIKNGTTINYNARYEMAQGLFNNVHGCVSK